MSTRKIKALGIAPYEGLKTMMMNLAFEQDDIDLTVYVGDLEDGVKIATQTTDSYDVIISRGGTAKMIRRLVTTPVIEINLSVFDVLRAIKLAENCSSQYAIVGFQNITESAKILCDLIQNNIEIITINSMEEAKKSLQDLQKRGYRIIICDMVTNRTAKTMGLNAILITSGRESIESAFEQARQLCTSYAITKEQNRFFDAMIHNQPIHSFVYSKNGCLQFTTMKADPEYPIFSILEREIKKTLMYGEQKITHTQGNTLFTIIGKVMVIDDKEFVSFFVSCDKVSFHTNRTGLQFRTAEEVIDSTFHMFYDISSGVLRATVQLFYQRKAPLLILGEQGTGKEPIAGIIYSQSNYSNNPFIIIDCSLLNDKCWNFLFNHSKSPLYDTDSTIFIKNVHTLSESWAKQLFSFIADVNLFRNNLVIFSFTYTGTEYATHPIYEYIVSQFSAFVMMLLPLRERKEEMSNLVSLTINELNMTLAKQVTLLEPEASKLLEDFPWPHNFTQFKRVLRKLMENVNAPCIDAENVRLVLAEETKQYPSVNLSGKDFCLNRTLNEINRDAVQIVLDECGGNQSKAAKKLGISRTTLWRMIK